MRGRIAFAAVLGMTLLASPQDATAQTQQSCNLRQMVDDLKKESSNWGYGQYIRGADYSLKRFEAAINDLISKPAGFWPVDPSDKNPDETKRRVIKPATLLKQWQEFASVSGDQSDFNDLLTATVSLRSQTCTRCRLLPIWQVFREAGYPNVTQEVLERVKPRGELFAVLQRDAKWFSEELSKRSSQLIEDGLRERIRVTMGLMLDSTTDPGQTGNFMSRYRDERGLDGGTFAASMRSLTTAECPN